MDEKGSSSASGASSSSFNGSQLTLSGMDDAAEMEDAETYEGVTSSDFQEFSEMVVSRIDGLYASSVVLVFALMLCAGILAVSTLVRSLESA